jgi:hypothetical protein
VATQDLANVTEDDGITLELLRNDGTREDVTGVVTAVYTAGRDATTVEVSEHESDRDLRLIPPTTNEEPMVEVIGDSPPGYVGSCQGFELHFLPV